MIKSFKELVEIAQKLRGPDGCPWDKSKTFENIQKDFMEEADEVREALEKKDWDNLKEELGDILFNIVMMTTIAEEQGFFSMKDVLQDIQKKIVDRHTWVFGDDKASTPEEALALWNKNKEKEKANKKK
jgi:uncharacterized protein YabN with tetrapyrrole methylase and pyrophosphatase domain